MSTDTQLPLFQMVPIVSTRLVRESEATWPRTQVESSEERHRFGGWVDVVALSEPIT